MQLHAPTRVVRKSPSRPKATTCSNSIRCLPPTSSEKHCVATYRRGEWGYGDVKKALAEISRRRLFCPGPSAPRGTGGQVLTMPARFSAMGPQPAEKSRPSALRARAKVAGTVLCRPPTRPSIGGCSISILSVLYVPWVLEHGTSWSRPAISRPSRRPSRRLGRCGRNRSA